MPATAVGEAVIGDLDLERDSDMDLERDGRWEFDGSGAPIEGESEGDSEIDASSDRDAVIDASIDGEASTKPESCCDSVAMSLHDADSVTELLTSLPLEDVTAVVTLAVADSDATNEPLS